MAHYFAVHPTKKFIAVFSPKCACTTIKDWFDHSLASEGVDRDLGQYLIAPRSVTEYSAYRKIFFVRNPLHRLVSFYCHWVIRDDKLWCFADEEKQFGLYDASFSEFLYILQFLWNNGLEFQHHLVPQTKGIDGIRFDHIVKTEDFDLEIGRLNSILGIDYVPRMLNQTDYNPNVKKFVYDHKRAWFRNVGIPSWEYFYNDRLIDIVSTIYASDVSFYASIRKENPPPARRLQIEG